MNSNTYSLYILGVDGVLTETKSGFTFRGSADDWQWRPHRREKCRELKASGALIVLASNQAGVAFKWSSFSQQEMEEELEKLGTEIGVDLILTCFSTPNTNAMAAYFHPDDPRRKPNPGMFLEAMEKFGVAPSETLVVGFLEDDKKAAEAAGTDYVSAEQFFQ